MDVDDPLPAAAAVRVCPMHAAHGGARGLGAVLVVGRALASSCTTEFGASPWTALLP